MSSWNACLSVSLTCVCGQVMGVHSDFAERPIPATVVSCICGRSYQLQGELDVVEVAEASSAARVDALANAIDRHGPEFA